MPTTLAGRHTRWWLPFLIALTLFAGPCDLALAHAIDSDAPAAYLSAAWSLEPWVLACIGASGVLYALGIVRLWRHAGVRRGITPLQAAAFVAGWLLLLLALVSPLDSLGAALFWAHMVQHELLMIVVAPLFVLGRPLAAWAWAFPLRWRQRIGRALHRPVWRVPWLLLTAPGTAWTLHAAALCLWHVPAFFDAALANEAVHTFQHLCFLFTALLFWWSLLQAATGSRQVVALVSLMTTFVYTGVLGALLTLAPTAWYPAYHTTVQAFGLSPLEDQQLGGLVMWIPAGLVYVLIGVVIGARWMDAGKPRIMRTA